MPYNEDSVSIWAIRLFRRTFEIHCFTNLSSLGYIFMIFNTVSNNINKAMLPRDFAKRDWPITNLKSSQNCRLLMCKCRFANSEKICLHLSPNSNIVFSKIFILSHILCICRFIYYVYVSIVYVVILIY